MFIKELQDLGLAEKEARVYLASLESGPETAQNIAKKAGVNRPTTYVQIELLKKKGLMSQYEQGGRTYFAAESPNKLNNLIANIEQEVAFKKTEIERLLPGLLALTQSSDEKPKVRFFEGEEALVGLREEYLGSQNKTLISFQNQDEVYGLFPNIESEYTKERIKRGIKAYVIYTSKNGSIANFNDPAKLRFAKFFEPKNYPFESDIGIFDDKVEIQTWKPKPIAVIIESATIANTFRALFHEMWKNLKPEIDIDI